VEITKRIGLKVPEVMLPAKSVNLERWAVVACDQYTSQREYWDGLADIVGDSPSTLHIIFPEVYLEDTDGDQRIQRITSTMEKYCNENILEPLKPGFVYLKRQTSRGSTRDGLMVLLDLECYDYSPGSQTLIRATEGTVLQRIPPRVRIREGACLELPHIMVLIDDPERTVIEPLSGELASKTPLYDFDLVKDGGHVKGFLVDDTAVINRITNALVKLADPAAFRKKYDVGPEKEVLLYAVGDGNHSLATAKACWENLKRKLSAKEHENHPARYALVELVNVHDKGLTFEPIHRVLFSVKPESVLSAMSDYFGCNGQGFGVEYFADGKSAMDHMKALNSEASVHAVACVWEKGWGVIRVDNPKSNLSVGSLQAFIDEYVKSNPKVSVDYIHGDDVTEALGKKPGNLGFLLPVMDKNDLFKTVILDGVLPRKTFSMGEADEKRYYLECRKITP